MKSFQLLLNEFTALNQLPALSLSEEGRCSLLVDNQLLVNLQVSPDEQLFVVSAVVGQLREKDTEKQLQLEVMARANYLWIGTRGLTLSLAPDGKQITLASQLPSTHLNAGEFSNAFDHFINQGMGWIGRLGLGLNATENLQPETGLNIRHEIRV